MGWTLNVSSVAPDEQAVVRSMMALLQGRFADPWSFAEPHEADLFLMRGPDTSTPRRAAGGQFVIVRFLDPSDPRPVDDTLTVERPLRAMPFLELLNEAGRRLGELKARAGPQSTPSRGDGTKPMFAAARLHQLRVIGPQAGTAALVAADGSELAIVLPNRGVVASLLPFSTLLEQLDKSFEPFLPLRELNQRQSLVVEHHSQPFDGLCWLAGVALARSAGLAPWLNKDDAYRLVAWPDFGVIGADESGFRLSAILAKRAMTPASLASATRLTFEQVASFLNAASICRLLVKGELQTTGKADAGPTPTQRSLIGRLRAKLGLS